MHNDRDLIEPVGQRLEPETETAIKTEIKLEGMGSAKR